MDSFGSFRKLSFAIMWIFTESVVIDKEAKNEVSNLQYDSDLSTGTPRFIRIQRQEQQDKLNQGTRNQGDNNTTGSRNLKTSENNAKPKGKVRNN